MSEINRPALPPNDKADQAFLYLMSGQFKEASATYRECIEPDDIHYSHQRAMAALAFSLSTERPAYVPNAVVDPRATAHDIAEAYLQLATIHHMRGETPAMVRSFVLMAQRSGLGSTHPLTPVIDYRLDQLTHAQSDQ